MSDPEVGIADFFDAEKKVLHKGIPHWFIKLTNLGEVLQQCSDSDAENFRGQACSRGECEGAWRADVHDDEAVIAHCVVHGRSAPCLPKQSLCSFIEFSKRRSN